MDEHSCECGINIMTRTINRKIWETFAHKILKIFMPLLTKYIDVMDS